MKLYRFLRGDREFYGVEDKEGALAVIKGSPFGEFEKTGVEYKKEDVKILSPSLPSKIIAVGLNYKKHAEELNMALPEEPIIFFKPPTAVIAATDEIIYPEMSKRVDYEAELGIIIKHEIFNVSKENALQHILGYCCANDVTARDLQKKDKQWTRAKSFNTFCPLGPCCVDNIDPDNLKISTRLNGKAVQSSSTSNFIFKVSYIVSFISKIMTLLPGDVILTGTPPGVGPVKKGDVLEVEIEGIGVLRNKVV